MTWLGLFTFTVLALVSSPGDAVARPHDFRFTSGHSALCIPFAPDNRQISLRARIDERDAAWLLLDTGAAGSVLDERRAAALGLETVGHQESLGAFGRQAGSIVRGVRVALPGFELLDQTMDTLSLEALSAQAGRPMDGILGRPLFDRCVVEIDYQRRCVSLHDAARFRYHGKGTIVPIEILEDQPYVTARVVLPGGRPITGRLVIDTGASSSLILSPDPADREELLATFGKTVSVQAHGVGGGGNVRIARVERLELGGFALERPITVLQPAGSGRVSAPGTLGNIGGGILSRFKVIFDYQRRRMILEAGPQIAEPFEADMSGLGLATTPPEYRRVRVSRVLDGSPALEAGVQAGDEVETVDGTLVAEIGVPALRERLRREGEDVRLQLRRGAERITVTLHTRRMI